MPYYMYIGVLLEDEKTKKVHGLDLCVSFIVDKYNPLVKFLLSNVTIEKFNINYKYSRICPKFLATIIKFIKDNDIEINCSYSTSIHGLYHLKNEEVLPAILKLFPDRVGVVIHNNLC